MDPSEMEQLQRLSDQYHADLPGPLIGEKLPMNVLVTEYAQADPVYVVKTTGLAATHSAYRPIKGDGQCGWRGAVFGYFEMLLSLGDAQLVEQETVRLKSFEDTMRMVGVDYDILSVMFDDTWDLFENIRKAVEERIHDDGVILNILNDENRSNSIVYHFKVRHLYGIRASHAKVFADDDKLLDAAPCRSIRAVPRHESSRVST